MALDDISNGLQFPPQSNDGIINAFDNLYQRPFSYEYNSDSSVDGPDGVISTKIFKEKDLEGSTGDDLTSTPKGTLSLGPAFNLDFVVAKRGCINCDETLT